ncbi:MAG: NUDIX domain-containing protein [bacterium]
MKLYEKKLSEERIFDGFIFRVHRDTVELADGRVSFREIVDHHGGVSILALDEKGMVPLVRQFRYAYGKEILEIPAGKLEAGEEPLDCALRELSEETGYSAGHIESLGTLYPTPGYCSEIIHLYFATDLRPGKAHLDEGEFLNVEKLPFETLCERCLSGEIHDAKTVVAALRAKARL